MSRGSRLPRTATKERISPATGDVFLVVTEGEVTEPEYLEALRGRLGIDEKRFTVCQAEGTDAVTIVREAKEKKNLRIREAQKGGPSTVPYDQVWVVFDTERHDINNKLLPAIDQARALGIQVALSNPSIEYWFLLHFVYTTRPFVCCTAVIRYLKDNGWSGYSKRRGANDYSKILDSTLHAADSASRCRDYHKKPVEKSDPSTSVDKLARAMNESVKKSHRLPSA